jgi:hypothetical protein
MSQACAGPCPHRGSAERRNRRCVVDACTRVPEGAVCVRACERLRVSSACVHKCACMCTRVHMYVCASFVVLGLNSGPSP